MPTYKQCIYQRYEINPEQNQIRFYYSLDKDIHFHSEYTLDLSATKQSDFDWVSFERAVFALGLAELPSYYKTFCPKEIRIEADVLSHTQKEFWEKVYTKGLGEFFYKNKIDFRNLINIQSEKEGILPPGKKTKLEKKYLVLYGGGKDSLVSGAFFEKEQLPFSWVEVQTVIGDQPILKRAEKNLITVIRRLDSKLLTLNSQGAYNGHVPISSVFAMTGVVVAILQGYTDVVASNEQSANEGNVEYLGMSVNHQYSKSFEFERGLHDYVQEFISPNITYYSLLRPLYELQIARIFSRYPQYFSSFISCNKGLKTGIWCGTCAKCVFVFSILHAWIPKEIMTKMFKKNLFEDEKLFPLFEELLGLRACKPFDCVGTKEEMAVALFLASKWYEQMPLVLEQLKQYPEVFIQGQKQEKKMVNVWNTQHLIPKALVKKVKAFV